MSCLNEEKNYDGKNVALASFGTSCGASSDANNNTCDKAIDGRLSTRWISAAADDKWFIAFNFTSYYNVQRINVYSRCFARNQCKAFDFIFSDGTVLSVSGICYLEYFM